MSPVRACHRSQSEGAVDMHPRIRCLCDSAGLPGRIEGTSVQVTGLNADDRRRGQGWDGSGRIRPWPTTVTRTSRFRSGPRRLNAFSTLTRTSAPTITVIGGAPDMPRASTSHPNRSSSACRAARRLPRWRPSRIHRVPPAPSSARSAVMDCSSHTSATRLRNHLRIQSATLALFAAAFNFPSRVASARPFAMAKCK